MADSNSLSEKTIRSQTVFTGRVVRLEVLDVELEDGRTAYREVVRHKGAVAVLGRTPDGRFVFVRQYRKAAEKVMLEVVAGILEPGEPHAEAARREMREETGYDIVRLTSLGAIFPTPAYVDERIEVYAAELSAEAGPHDRDHDERLEVVTMTAGEFEDRIGRGEIEDAKTLALWSLYRAAARRGGAPETDASAR
jgi:ADP-ribose pyrophosphatase